MQDLTNRRLLESAAIHLELDPLVLTEEQLNDELLQRMELVIADEPAARKILTFTLELKRKDDPYCPALIAVITAAFNINDSDFKDQYDGVLPMPQLPANLAAQLSVALYSHRSFAKRYEDAMEELQLNRRIFRSVTSGVSVSDAREPDMPLTYVNPSFEAMTGYSLEDAQGKNCRFLQGEDRDQPGLKLVREALRNGTETVAVLRNYRKDGTPFWNELTLSPIRAKDGQITHFLGIQSDVTSRVDAEIALRQSEKLAVTGRLAASIAHEINNPLESIMNLVYLAEREEDLAEVRRYLSSVDEELRRVKLITAQSLRFSKQSTKPQAVDCSELLDSVLHIQHARIQGAGVKVHRRDGFSESIVCLESEIRQVLNNLISNATDAMRAKGGDLLIRSRHATDPKRGHPGVVFTVADNGVGMPSEVRSKMFHAFYSTKGSQGTGLGLWISAEIVARHHGYLRVRSRDEGSRTGTVFQLFLPYQGIASAPRQAPHVEISRSSLAKQ